MRPSHNVSTPTARAAGIAELEILVDTREQYAYRFSGQLVAARGRIRTSYLVALGWAGQVFAGGCSHAGLG